MLEVLSDSLDLAFGWIELVNSPKKLPENVTDSLRDAFHTVYFIRLTV